MRVKYLAIIEFAVLSIAFIPTFVFWVISLPIVWLFKVVAYVWEISAHWKFKFGNWLLRHSKEAKSGMIRNKSILRNMTAYDFEKMVKKYSK